MKKSDLVQKMADSASTSQGEAADRLDLEVHRIVTKLRAGKSCVLPGLGRFDPGRGTNPSFAFDRYPDMGENKTRKRGDR